MRGLPALGKAFLGRPVGLFAGVLETVGIAAALLGDPQTVILDEPGKRLDPEGILWIRGCCAGWRPRAARCCSPRI